MPGFNFAAKDVMLGALRAELTEVSLHSADPGDSGSSELTGEDYARQAVTVTEPSDGEMFVDNEPTFDVPPNATVRYVGIWAGTAFRGSALVTEEVYSDNGGTYTVLNTTRLDLNG